MLLHNPETEVVIDPHVDNFHGTGPQRSMDLLFDELGARRKALTSSVLNYLMSRAGIVSNSTALSA